MLTCGCLLFRHRLLKRLFLTPLRCLGSFYHSFQVNSFRATPSSIIFNKTRIYDLQSNQNTHSCDALLVCPQPSRPGYPSPRSSEGFYPSPQHMVQTNHYQVRQALPRQDMFSSLARLGIGKDAVCLYCYLCT